MERKVVFPRKKVLNVFIPKKRRLTQEELNNRPSLANARSYDELFKPKPNGYIVFPS